jgi:hypothetical protein
LIINSSFLTNNNSNKGGFHMTKTIFATFYTRQDAENAINNLKNDILPQDNPVILRDNIQNINQTEQCQTPPAQETKETQGMQNPTCGPSQMPGNNSNYLLNGYAQQNLYNGYSSGSTLGGLFGLATSAVSMATIGVPYILTTTLANMFSLPMPQNPLPWGNSTYPMAPNNTGYPSSGNDPASPPQNLGVLVTLNVPEEKVWDIANSLKSSNAVEVKSS